MIYQKDTSEYLDFIITLKKDFKIRESSNFVEIISSNGQKVISNKNKKFSKGLYLFNMVKKYIRNFIDDEGFITPFDELPVNFCNDDFDKDTKNIIGYDINNAYWSVAYLKGYISENTYKKGIEKEGLKAVRLSALSCLGKDKMYKVYENGEHKHNELTKGDKELRNFYLDIRYSTYGVLNDIAIELGTDFCCWKTDCIFFYDTKENRELVKNRIEQYGLECKTEML